MTSVNYYIITFIYHTELMNIVKCTAAAYKLYRTAVYSSLRLWYGVGEVGVGNNS